MALGNLAPIPDSYISNNGATTSTNESSDENIKTIEEQIKEIKEKIPDVPKFIPKYSGALFNKIKETLTKSQDASEQAKLENEIIERMQENRKYLELVDWTKIVVTLPDIFISEYDVFRFKFETERYIRMIYRTKYVKYLLDMIDSKKDRQRLNYYLSGYSGCGKSALLYQLACNLMSTGKYLIVYVQFSSESLIADILRCLYFECKSIRFSDYLDQLKTKEAEAGSKVLTDEEVINISLLLRNVKKKLLFDHKMTLVFIIDQTNNLLRNTKMFKQMINFIKNNLLLHHIVIMSGSANNEIEKFPGLTPQLVRLPFSEEELKAFIIMNRPDEKEQKIWCEDRIISQILGITGSVAIEINRFVNGYYNDTEQISSSTTLEKRFGKYDFLYRKQYNPYVLQEWYNKQVEQNIAEIAIDNIERCFTGVDLGDNSPEIYDKRLIIRVSKVIRKNQDDEDKLVILDDFEIEGADDDFCSWYLMPISPVARKCLFDAYRRFIEVSDFQKQFSFFFETNKLNPTQKGFYVEQLLITLISLGILKQVEVHTISPDKKIDDSPKTKLLFKDLTVINFGGYFAPNDIHTSQFDSNLLFVPTSYNYPGFDFFTFTPNPKAALFHQVTIMMDCHKHIASNDTKASGSSHRAGTLPSAMRSWKTFLPNGTPVYDIYFVRKHELDTSQLERPCNFVFLEEIDGEGLGFLSSHFQSRVKGFSA